MDWGTILLCAGIGGVVIWFWYAVCWMGLHHHKADFRRLPNRGPIEQALDEAALTPGLYNLPHMEEFEGGMKSEAFQQRWKHGPNAMIVSLGPNIMSGAMFVRALLINLLEGFLIAVGLSLSTTHSNPGLAGTALLGAMIGLITGLIGYGTMSNWMGMPWRFAWTNVFDKVTGYAIAGAVMFWLGITSSGAS